MRAGFGRSSGRLKAGTRLDFRPDSTPCRRGPRSRPGCTTSSPRAPRFLTSRTKRTCWTSLQEPHGNSWTRWTHLPCRFWGQDKTVWSNSGTTIQDLGDGILNIAFHTKMNTIGAEVIEGLNKVIDLAESDSQWRGVVISNEGGNFSAGANVGMIMLAVEQEWDELDYAIRLFQNTTMRLRYSGIPVVAAHTN